MQPGHVVAELGRCGIQPSDFEGWVAFLAVRLPFQVGRRIEVKEGAAEEFCEDGCDEAAPGHGLGLDAAPRFLVRGVEDALPEEEIERLCDAIGKLWDQWRARGVS